MNYTEYEFNNVKIYIYKTKKFKTIKINLMLINNYTEKDFTFNRLLNKVLKKSSKKYTDEIKISKYALSIYDPLLSIYDIYSNIHEKNFEFTFLNEKYTEKNMNKKNIDFMFDCIFNPNVINDEFEKNNFELCKNSLEISYNLDEENPNYIADCEAYLNLGEDLPSKYLKNGCKKDLKNINTKNLYNFYLNQLNNSEYKIFIAGDVIDDEILVLLKEHIKKRKIKKFSYDIRPYILTNSSNKKEIIKKKNFNQSILIMIYKILNITDYERKYVLPLLNILLGGNAFKLFNNVREKNSLVYYISSYIISFESLLEIEAGITKQNYEKTVELCRNEINEIKNGNITDEEMSNLIERVRFSIYNTEDSLGALLNRLIGIIHIGRKSPKEEFEIYKKVTKKEISLLANKLELDVQYLLEGVDDENN